MTVIRGEDFDKMGIKIHPIDQEKSIQGASYDLRIGDQILIWSEYPKVVNPSSTEVWLYPLDIAVIKTLESVSISADACGFISSMVAYQSLGIHTGPTTIDPSFEGHMFIAMANFGKQAIRLEYSKQFCTAMFFKMEEETKIKFRRTQDFNELLQVFATQLHVILGSEKPPAREVSHEEVLKAKYFGPEVLQGMQEIISKNLERISSLEDEIKLLQGYQKVIRKMIKIIPWLIGIPIITTTWVLSSSNNTVILTVSSVVSIFVFLLNIFDIRILRRFGIEIIDSRVDD